MYFKVCTLTAQNAKALVRLIALLQPCCFLYYALGGTCKVYEQCIYREEEMSKHEQCSGQERIVISSWNCTVFGIVLTLQKKCCKAPVFDH
jgi:hypothetical protein